MSTHVKTTDMTRGSVPRHLIRFAIPLIIGAVCQHIYGLADTLIAGHAIGDDAIAAIGATSSLYSLLISFANGLNSGCSIILSRAFGSGDRKKFKNAALAAVLLNGLTTLLLTFFSLLLLRPAMGLLNTPSDIFSDAYTYIFIVLSGMAATMFYNMCAGFLRAVGNSRTPLYFLLFSCFLNLILDPFFILALQAGVAGAAAATVISQAISGILCCFYIYRNYQEFLPEWNNFRKVFPLFKEMAAIGFAAAAMHCVYSIGSILLQTAINGLGSAMITAHTTARRLIELITMPGAQMGLAISTFSSQNFGARQYSRIRKGLKFALIYDFIWAAFALTLILFAGRSMIGLLSGTKNQEIISNGYLSLFLSASMLFPLGVLSALRMAMQAVGHTIIPILSSSIELLIKGAACFYFIPRIGYAGAAMAEPVVWLVCAVFLIFLTLFRHLIP